MCISEVEIPKYSLGEEIWNAISHGLGAIFGIVALALMLVKTIPSGDPFSIISALVYGISLIILFTISCIYHALATNNGKRVLRIMDHNSIFVLLMGSYIPYTLVALRPHNIWNWGTGVVAYVILGIVLGSCTLGIIFNSINIKKYAWLSMTIYIVAGWAIIIAIFALWQTIGVTGTWLLISSGIVYTIGAIIYGYGKKGRYIHTIWHFFVLIAAILMFLSIYIFVL